MTIRQFILLLFLFNLSQISFGQEPFSWNIGEEEGLPSMTAFRIIQDQKGFIWIGTENGLCKYDGKKIKTYKNPQLIDNEILDLQEDSYGRIWIKNLGGQLAYVQNDSLHIPNIPQAILAHEFVINGNDLWILSKLSRDKLRELFYYEINPTGLNENFLKANTNNRLCCKFEKYDNKILIIGPRRTLSRNKNSNKH